MLHLKIEKFRDLRNLEIPLKPGLNLIAGHSACGKTSVTEACKCALDALLASHVCCNPCTNDWGKRLRTILESESDFSLRFRMDNKENAATCKNVCLRKGDVTKESWPAKLEFLASAMGLAKTDVQRFPVIASYGHRRTDLDDMEASLCGERWQTQIAANPEMRNLVCSQITRVLGKGCGMIASAGWNDESGEIRLQLTDGRTVAEGHLPEGIKWMVSWIADLTVRCVGSAGEEGLRSEGTVVMDDVDWITDVHTQSRLSEAMTSAFPNMQFILTAHSPMMMSCVRNNDRNGVYWMRYDAERGYLINEVSTYGQDVSTIMETQMETVSRCGAVDHELSTLFGKIDLAEYEEAQNMLDTMRRTFGDHLPELAKAETMITLLKLQS